LVNTHTHTIDALTDRNRHWKRRLANARRTTNYQSVRTALQRMIACWLAVTRCGRVWHATVCTKKTARGNAFWPTPDSPPAL